MESKMMTVVMLALVALMSFGGFVNTASAAPASVGDSTSLGGNISGQDGYPSLYSSATVNNETVTGSFNITLDASQVSLSSASWSFYTDSWDPSQWMATCYMYGYRDSSERWPQNQNWYQKVSPEDGPSITASVGFSSYETPSDQDIRNLKVQCLLLQIQLLNAPEDQRADIGAQLDMAQAMLASLQQQPRKDVLQVYGDINLKPSSVTSSDFSYTEYNEEHYGWSEETGAWIVTGTNPVWRAEFIMHGHFVADTLEQAQAMGAQFVPEPATMAFLAVGGIVALMRRRIKK